jgi:predicted phosphodiesterase
MYQNLFKSNQSSIFIVLIGDLHLGHQNYQEKYLNDTFKFINKNRDRCRILLLGDLLETATKTSPGRGTNDETMPVSKQLDLAVELFKPYRSLVDLAVIGNHEQRVSNDTSLDLMELMCQRLDIESKYSGFSGFAVYQLGDLIYSIFATHGSSSSAKEAGAVNSLLNLQSLALSNCYVQGHTHKLLSFSREVSMADSTNKPLSLELLFVNNGAALEYEGGYAQMKNLARSELGFCAIELFKDSRKMKFHKIKDLV